MKLKLIFLLGLMVLISMESFPQLIIKDTLGVRKPKEGSLYYQTKNQTLYLRRNSSFEIFEVKKGPIIPDLPPDPIPIPGNAMVVDVDRFASFWGNGGENPSNPYPEHKTYEDEQWMLTNWPNAAPFYAKKVSPKTIITDNWISGVFSGQTSRQVNYEYFVNEDVIDKMNNYMVESGLQGYDFTYYANDSPLCLWRQEFVKNQRKRGLKMFYTIAGLGGGAVYNQGIEEIANHMTQGFYKKIDGKPVLGYQAEPGKLSNQDMVVNMKNTINLIKQRYREIVGNPTAQFYTILCGVPYLENDGWYLNNGFDSVTPYYVDGEKTNGDFGIVVNNTKNLVNSYISSNRPIAIPITVGLDSRSRLWFYNQDPGGNFYNSQTLIQKLPELISYSVEKANQNKNLVKIILFKYADEHTEQASGGFGFMPTLKSDGTINDSVIKVIKNELR